MELILKQKSNTFTYPHAITNIIPPKKQPQQLSTIQVQELEQFYDRLDKQFQSKWDEDNWQMFMDASVNDKEEKIIPTWERVSRPMTQIECEEQSWAGWTPSGGCYK